MLKLNNIEVRYSRVILVLKGISSKRKNFVVVDVKAENQAKELVALCQVEVVFPD